MNRGTSGERRDSSLDESSPRKKEGSRFYLISLAGENFLLSSLDVSRVFSSLPLLFSLSNERQKRDPQKDVSCGEGGRRVVGVEMNWQLLIKIVSCSLPRPRSRGCSPFSGKSAEKTPFRLTNLTKQGEGGGLAFLRGTRLAFFLFMPTIHHG